MDYVLSGGSDFTPGKKIKSYSVLKRILDFLVALTGGLVALIPCLAVAAAIRLEDKGPVLFCQERVGRNGQPFTCYKFRTMRMDAPHNCATIDMQDGYITRVGKILRKASIDEIPQLINIIKGEMSVIGPRPLIPGEEYIHRERYRRGVYFLRPGISGLAQVNGRDNLSPDAKVRFDEEYLKKCSLGTDIGILVKTVLNVLQAKDIVDGNQPCNAEDGQQKTAE